MSQLTCVVVTPETTVLEQEAEFLVLPLFDGEKGVALNHSPMIGRLGYGEMRVRSDGKTERYYVDGGFVQIADNVVSVLTNRALPADKIDTEAVRAQLEEAAKLPAHTPELLETRDRQIAQGRAQLRVSERAG